MSELEKIVGKYLKRDNNAIVYYDIDQEILNKTLSNMKEYERPDIISILDNKVTGIEHFEFDSYNKSGKGSDFKIKDSNIEKEFTKKVNNVLKDKDSVISHDKIDSTSTLSNYFNNFKSVFLDHYSKIEQYIQQIKENFDTDNKEINIWFFVEDVSPLGSYFLDEKRKINLLNPLYSDEIIELLQNCPKVEYIIIAVYAMTEYKLIIIENKKEKLEKFKKERKKISEKDFLPFTPQTTGYAIKIPKEEFEKHTKM